MYSDSKADTSSQPGCAGEVARGIPCVSVAEAVEVPAEACPATAYDASYVADGTAVVLPSSAQPTYTGNEAVIHFLCRVCFVAYLVLAATLAIVCCCLFIRRRSQTRWSESDTSLGEYYFICIPTAALSCFVAWMLRTALPVAVPTVVDAQQSSHQIYPFRVWVLAPLLLCVTLALGGLTSFFTVFIATWYNTWPDIVFAAVTVVAWMVAVVSFLGYIILNLAKDCRGAR